MRELENDPLGVPAELWGQLADTGILGMLLPEEYGGMGFTMVDAAVVYEELGRALAPGPQFVSAVMVLLAIKAAGTVEQKRIHACPGLAGAT